MKENKVAKRYASGLIKTLKNEKEYREVKKELEQFLELLNGIEDFKAGMESLLFSKRQKKEIFDSLHQKIKFNEKTHRFLLEVLEENRLVFLETMIQLLEELWFEKNGIEKLKVYSAVPISSKLEDKLIKNLEKSFNKTIVIEKETDPSLIAGIKIQRGLVYYDFSIQGNLNKLKEALVADESLSEASAVVVGEH